MEKIVIINANNEQMQVEVVRYFSESNNKYFIFSLHEVDAQGHMNIYVTKIVEQNGSLIGTNIIDDVEWTNVKTNLQRIIKENRANANAVVNDLPYTDLQNIKVADRRALKLLANSVDMLNMGYNPTINVENEQPNNIDPVPQQSQPNIFDQQPMQNPQPSIQNMQQPMQNPQPSIQNMQQPVQNPQPSINMQQPVQDINVQSAQPINNVQNNTISDNYKDLYFKEKENTERLIAENNRLTNELNNCKLMISDIKNILSRQ